MAEDTKEIQIPGCQVRLTYRQVADGGWSVFGIVRCRRAENRKNNELRHFRTREAAEKDALNRISPPAWKQNRSQQLASEELQLDRSGCHSLDCACLISEGSRGDHGKTEK